MNKFHILLNLAVALGSAGCAKRTPVSSLEGIPNAPEDKLGVDNNNNRLWDDAEALIEKKYSSTPALKQAVTNYALGFQDALENASSKEKSIVISHRMTTAFACVSRAAPRNYQITAEIESIYSRTPIRAKAYIKYNSHLGGQVYTLPDDDTLKEECAVSADNKGR